MDLYIFFFQDWPVDIGWFRTKLNCTLSGSTKEVYETGSQVADLYILLATFLKPSTFLCSIGSALSNTVHSATSEEFPDLAKEMGLENLSREDIGTNVSRPCIDEEVRYIHEATIFCGGITDFKNVIFSEQLNLEIFKKV